MFSAGNIRQRSIITPAIPGSFKFWDCFWWVCNNDDSTTHSPGNGRHINYPWWFLGDGLWVLFPHYVTPLIFGKAAVLFVQFIRPACPEARHVVDLVVDPPIRGGTSHWIYGQFQVTHQANVGITCRTMPLLSSTRKITIDSDIKDTFARLFMWAWACTFWWNHLKTINKPAGCKRNKV